MTTMNELDETAGVPVVRRKHFLAFCDQQIRAILAGRMTQARKVISPGTATFDGRVLRHREWLLLVGDIEVPPALSGRAWGPVGLLIVQRQPGGPWHCLLSRVDMGDEIVIPGGRMIVRRVWAQRLHDMTELDARAEGCDDLAAFFALWDRLQDLAERKAATNPWVWVYEWDALAPAGVGSTGEVT